MRSAAPCHAGTAIVRVLGLAVLCLMAADRPTRAATRPPEVLWKSRFGSAGDANALEIVRHATGIYVIGRVDGVMPGQSRVGGHDIYVRRMDQDGKEIWTRQFGTEGRETNMGIFVHDSGIYATGGVGGALPGQEFAGPPFDAFVRKLDFDGNVVWTRQFGSAGYDTGRGIAVEGHGKGGVRIYVAGAGGALPGQPPVGGETDVFLHAYDGDGTLLWTRQFGSARNDQAWDVVAHSSGIYVAGTAGGAMPGQTHAGGADVFVRRCDRDGHEVWTRQFGGPGDDIGFPGGFAVDDSGAYVSGLTKGALPGHANAGDFDAFVLKYDLDGRARWTRQYGTTAYDDAHGIAVFGGAVYVVGNTYGALPGVRKQAHAGDGDAYLRRYDARDGAETWTLQTGTPGFEEFFGVVVDGTGVYVVGFEGPPGEPPGPNDVFVARIGPDPAGGPRGRKRSGPRT